MRSSTQPVILLLDDDQDTRELVQLTLALVGIRVHGTTTHREAWDFAVANWFDLYLLDGKMPGGDSFQLCADLREFAPEKPIVFYSGMVSPDYMQSAFDAGASAFLKKPFMGDLGDEITRLLRTGTPAAETVFSDNEWIDDSALIVERSNRFTRTVGSQDDVADNVLSFATR